MARHLDQAFPKSCRLRKRAEFVHVQTNGRRIESRAYIGLFVQRGQEPPRLGITTTKRLGPAVVRNRARRLVREAFRRGELALPPGIDLVVIPKTAATELDGAGAAQDLARLASRVRRALERSC
jgi:ribonuclease P protein component